MKNSTLHRSNLSKERMALLEELKNESINNDNTPGVYVRPSKEKELDALWDTFKVSTKHDNSPGAYLMMGFIIGAVCMALMGLIVTFVGGNANSSETKQPRLVRKVKVQKPSKNITIIPADTPVNAAAKKSDEIYTVQSGGARSGGLTRRM